MQRQHKQAKTKRPAFGLAIAWFALAAALAFGRHGPKEELTVPAPALSSTSGARMNFSEETRKNLIDLHSEQRLREFIGYADRVARTLVSKGLVNTVVLTVPTGPCMTRSRKPLDALSRFSSLHEITFEMCFALLTSPFSDKTPTQYWREKWQTLFAHEYKHALYARHMGLDPLQDDEAQIRQNRRKLEERNLGLQEYVFPAPEKASMWAYALSEVGIKMRRLPDEPIEDAMAETITTSSLSNSGSMNDWIVTAMHSIFAEYALTNELFRQTYGISLPDARLKEIHDNLQRELWRHTSPAQLLMAKMMYAELQAHAKLAELEGFMMQE